MQTQSADVKLSDLTVFIEWMQQAVRAIEQDAPVPGQPTAATGEVASWMRLIRHLDDRRRHGEEIQLGLQADLHSREAALAGLTQQLDSSMNEAKNIQATCRDLRREIASYKSQLGKAGELAEQFDELDAEVKAMVGDLSEKSDKLASLAAALQQAVVALRAMDARDPSNNKP
jgi:chromosome segregation ATPase